MINRGASFQSLLDPLPVFGLGLWGSAPLRRSVTFLCMCERVLEPVCSVTQDRSFILKNGVTLFGECVLPSWCPLVVLRAPSALHTPLALCWGCGTSRQKPSPSDCPLPLSVSSAPSLALGCPPAGHPGLAQESRAGRLPHSLPPTIPVGVASCALGKAECSINFWCSGLLLWGFPLGQGWGCSRHSRCPWVLVIEGCRP